MAVDKGTKIKNRILTGGFAGLLCIFFLWCLCKPESDISVSERRPLAQRPHLKLASILSGDFMEEFEEYAMDQFPMRESFRMLKGLSSFYLFQKKDEGGLYLVDGYASKLEYPMNWDSLDYAANRFRHIYEKYLEGKDCKIYFSVIPDKNYFMAGENGYPAMDYEAFTAYFREKAEDMTYIDLFDCLELSDYYRTDTHWRQEKLVDAAKKLAAGMRVDLKSQYTVKELEQPFYGVYSGQMALPLSGERLSYLDNETLRACTVYDYETGKEIPLYDREKAEGKDPYEMFLGGAKSLLILKNPQAKTDRRLILFRDSFGSSIAPLLAEGYAQVVLVDIRYLSSDLLGSFLDFENCDVLFLYSTLVLNNSSTMR